MFLSNYIHQPLSGNFKLLRLTEKITYFKWLIYLRNVHLRTCTFFPSKFTCLIKTFYQIFICSIETNYHSKSKWNLLINSTAIYVLIQFYTILCFLESHISSMLELLSNKKMIIYFLCRFSHRNQWKKRNILLKYVLQIPIRMKVINEFCK